MGAIALAASLCSLIAGADPRLEADLHVASAVRRFVYEDQPSFTRGDLLLIPRLALEAEGRMTFQAAYGPSFFLPVDVSAGAPELRSAEVFSDRVQVLHRGSLLARLQIDRRFRAGLRAEGTYGRTDLLAPELWTPERVPTTGRIEYLDARALFSFTGETSRRSSFSLETGLFTRGGANAAAQTTLPLERGLLFDATLDWSATRRTVLSAVFGANASRFEPGADAATAPGGDAVIARAGARWRRLATRQLALRAGGGAAATYSELMPTLTVRKAAPWAEAGLRWSPTEARPSWNVLGTLEPVIDRLSGAVDLRLEIAATLAWRPARLWNVEGRGSAAVLRPWSEPESAPADRPDTRLYSLELRAGRRVGRFATASTGLRGRAQETPRADLPSFVEWGGFVELAIDSRSRVVQTAPALP